MTTTQYRGPVTRTRRYHGQMIRDCERETGYHPGRWVIVRYHQVTGLPYSDEFCSHYATLSQARDAINEAELWREQEERR